MPDLRPYAKLQEQIRWNPPGAPLPEREGVLLASLGGDDNYHPANSPDMGEVWRRVADRLEPTNGHLPIAGPGA